ncbi:hypothetical protein GCM10009765_16980 [Fodinicola feengrottensis]|uniref:Uncharacterized protein n=1 Tax=Fodinicola feengrottensis TaxID=435914 RepID=A0ABN2GAV8_9ACTN
MSPNPRTYANCYVHRECATAHHNRYAPVSIPSQARLTAREHARVTPGTNNKRTHPRRAGQNGGA